MAIVQNPLIGQTKGKVGNVVFYRSFENNIIRSKPLKVANPRTPGQVSARSMFKLCQSFVAKNLLLFRDTCQFLIDNNSAYIAVIKYYMNEVAIKENDVYIFDLEKMIFSAGELTNIAAPTLCQIDANFDISIEWNDNTGSGTAAADDIINFILFNVTTDIVKRFQTPRAAAQIAIPQTENGISENDEFQLFYFSSNATQTLFSNTSPATISAAPSTPNALIFTWDNIANAPERSLSGWNNYFNLPDFGTPFTSFEEIDNSTILYGGFISTVKDETIYNNSSLLKVEDFSNSLLHFDNTAFVNCPNLTVLHLPVTDNCPYGIITNSPNISKLFLPSILTCGWDSSNNGVFNCLQNQTILLTIPHSIESDGDIVALKANNTVTVIYSD